MINSNYSDFNNISDTNLNQNNLSNTSGAFNNSNINLNEKIFLLHDRASTPGSLLNSTNKNRNTHTNEIKFKPVSVIYFA